MSNYHLQIKEIVEDAIVQIGKIDDATFDLKPLPNKWSKKEILGHLIDSAYNNHQRFLRAEEQGNLVFGGYNQDEWVVKNKYQSRTKTDVVDTFANANHHLSCLIEGLSNEVLEHKTTDHNFHKICMKLIDENAETTLSYLIEDYIFHLNYHLKQIFV